MKGILPKDWQSQLFDWLTSIDQWNSPEGWLARGIIWFVAIYILIRILKYVLNEIIELHDKWTKLGLPVAISAEKKAKIRQRQQFCGVLRSDLASIAKAENWNDQFFTDLEAEVEAEGYYYTSAFNRLVRKKTSGLRKEPSLIKSIDRSAEQFLLLVGSPGSGKSVALRHLAHQLAERAIKSSGASERIPLYINLKELPSVKPEKLTSDFIKEFVLDNIRRGDADTADYIRENWDEYLQKGIWFFLFDSFDEIPAVLHAPTGSQVIQQHSEAIRQFLAGMSSCRGVVASREFKGPETLPWQKFRILPLNSQKKEEVIGNSFLKPEQKEIVRRHLATNESSIHNNPLFLTLLCRYVKEENAAPINDHDLLSRHIERLAYRDPDYTKKRYTLTPEQLLQGATQLAVLFAQNTELSLAPSQDEIADVLARRGESIDHFENLLAALIDVKIARSDVQEARHGDRRFTFSHRRYHETLFVHYLSENPDVIPPRELLTNLRWREYTVTLLQTQPLDLLTGILEEAELLLKEHAQAQEPVPILPEFGGHLSYYEWDDKIEVSLLNLLQEGFSKRIREIPEGVSKQTAALLEPRWRDGDEYDRVMVLEAGGTLPQEVLVEYLTYAVEFSSESTMWDIAFRKIAFLSDINEELSAWVRGRLSTAILIAGHQSDVLKLEALSVNLPDPVGASLVFSRSLSVRKMDFIRRFFGRGVENLFRITNLLISTDKSYIDLLFQIFLTMMLSLLFFLIFSYLFFIIQLNIDVWNFLRVACLFYSIIFVFLAIRFITLFIFRKTETKLLSFEIAKIPILANKKFIKIIVMSLLLSIALIIPGIIVAFLLNFNREDYTISGIISFIICNLGFASYRRYQECLYRKRLKNIKTREGNSTPVIFSAQSTDEVISWLKTNINTFLPNRQSIRSILRLLKSPPHFDPQHPIFCASLFKGGWSKNSASVSRLTAFLINKLKYQKSPAGNDEKKVS